MTANFVATVGAGPRARPGMAVGFMGHIGGVGRNAAANQQNEDPNTGARMLNANNGNINGRTAGYGGIIVFMDPMKEKTSRIRESLEKERQNQIARTTQSNVASREMFSRYVFTIIASIIFLGLAIYGIRFETVHGSIYKEFFWRIFLLGLLTAHFYSCSLFPLTYRSFFRELISLDRFRGRLGVLFILLYGLTAGFIFPIPLTGVIQSANAMLGSRTPIDIVGVTNSVNSSPLIVEFRSKFTHVKLIYRVLSVLNDKDRQSYVIDVPDEYFSKHHIAVGQPWHDRIYAGAFGIYYRTDMAQTQQP